MSEAACAYCGLPVPSSWWGRQSQEGHRFCCFGCRFAFAVARERKDSAGPATLLARLGISIFFAMNVMAFTMTLWSEDVYGPSADADRTAIHFGGIFRALSCAFSVPVLVLLGWPLARETAASLRQGRPNTDLLLLLGVVASFAVSIAALIRGSGPVYFEVGVVVLVLVTLGRWLEATGKQRATAALEDLQRLIPETVRRLDEQGESQVAFSDVQAGHRLRILPGERIPADGVIQSGHSSIDERLLTGESVPRSCEPGDQVHAGSLNVDGEIVLSVSSPADDGALARFIAAVRAAGLERGHYQRLADTAARWFLPMVVVVALATVVLHGLWNEWTSGLMNGLAVVVIACPCALGVATPLAMWSSIGRLARSGVIVRSGDAIEKLALIGVVAFDKTGTLTHDASVVAAEIFDPEADPAEVDREANELALATNHPHAHAVAIHLRERVEVKRNGHHGATKTVPGRGVIRELTAGGVAMLGSLRFADELALLAPPHLRDSLARAEARGQPAILFGSRGRLRAVYLIDERVRDEASEIVRSLQGRGLNVVILTGDQSARGEAIGRTLGVDVRTRLMPEAKVEAIRELQARIGPVLMVGDGLNDAPALAAAAVGLAMGCGADLTRESADVCLLSNDLKQIPTLLDWSQQTVRVVRQNLFWAFAYNIVGVSLAAAGRLNPVVAAVVMFLSSIFVVSNSWRLSARPVEAAI